MFENSVAYGRHFPACRAIHHHQAPALPPPIKQHQAMSKRRNIVPHFSSSEESESEEGRSRLLSVGDWVVDKHMQRRRRRRSPRRRARPRRRRRPRWAVEPRSRLSSSRRRPTRAVGSLLTPIYCRTNGSIYPDKDQLPPLKQAARFNELGFVVVDPVVNWDAVDDEWHDADDMTSRESISLSMTAARPSEYSMPTIPASFACPAGRPRE